jgi:hypothetical protein
MSFRQFGGLTYASKHNIVSNNYNTSNNLLIPNYFGQPNSIVNFLSDISGNIILYGNLTITENVHVDLNVDISGNATIGGTLDVSGNVNISSATTSTSFNTTSDYRIKSDIRPLNDAHIVDKLIPVTYVNTITNKPDFGLIAHEVQEHFPFIVNGEKDANDYQSVNYISLIPLLIKEIQELKKEIKLLKKI